MAAAQSLIVRDVSKGRIAGSAVQNSLAPGNSIANTLNVNYDTIIGAGIVRPGSLQTGATIAKEQQPLGFHEFVNFGGAINLLIATFSGNGAATVYYYDPINDWQASALTTLENNSKTRFDALGNRLFIVNGYDAMQSSADGITWTLDDCIPAPIIPYLVMRTKARLIVVATSPSDRIYFSSIIIPTNVPFITWNTDPTTGDWIDINPDDGQNITAFAQTANQTIVFKSGAMYRLNVISKTVDTENIFNVGAVSQEAVTTCQGVVYFYSGQNIYATDGTAPQQISRVSVQDFLDAIPQSYKSKVALGADENNVYVSIGNVTVGGREYQNVQLKFSTRDQSWSVHKYKKQVQFFADYTTNTGRNIYGATTVGDVVEQNTGTTDDGDAIPYMLETQEIECGNRGHVKGINNEVIVFTKNGQDSQLFYTVDGGDPKPIPGNLNKRVNVLPAINTEFRFITFIWQGTSKGLPPTFEGLQVENVTDNNTQAKAA